MSPRLMVGVVLLLLVLPLGVQAQPRSCSQQLSAASNQYQNGDFDRAIHLAYECLVGADADVASSERGFRIVALSYLKKDEISNAKLAIIRLLSASPNYEADPVQDPPSYIALVNNVRRQLNVAAETQSGEDTELPQQTLPYWTQRLIMGGAFGISHYGGERSASVDNVFSEVGSGSDIALTLRAGLDLSSWLGTRLFYAAGRYPALHATKTGPAFPDITRATSSMWIHALGISGVVSYPRLVSTYLLGGFTTAYTVKNGVYRFGFGPHLGLGIGWSFSDSMDIFGEGVRYFVFPGDAMDLTGTASGYDPLTTVTVGLKYRLRLLQ